MVSDHALLKQRYHILGKVGECPRLAYVTYDNGVDVWQVQ